MQGVVGAIRSILDGGGRDPVPGTSTGFWLSGATPTSLPQLGQNQLDNLWNYGNHAFGQGVTRTDFAWLNTEDAHPGRR